MFYGIIVGQDASLLLMRIILIVSLVLSFCLTALGMFFVSLQILASQLAPNTPTNWWAHVLHPSLIVCIPALVSLVAYLRIKNVILAIIVIILCMYFPLALDLDTMNDLGDQTGPPPQLLPI